MHVMYTYLMSSTFLRGWDLDGRKNQEPETLSRSGIGSLQERFFVFSSMIGYGSYSCTTAAFSFKSFHHALALHSILHVLLRALFLGLKAAAKCPFVPPTLFSILYADFLSPQRAPCKTRQNKARTMDLFIIVPAQLLLFFEFPLPQGHLDVTAGILAADHESDLARWVRRDSGVGIFDRGEYFLATFLQVGDEAEVQPLVFGLQHRRGGGGWRLAKFSVFQRNMVHML